MALDLSSLKEAVRSLEKALKVANSQEKMLALEKEYRDVIRAGVIQNFEYGDAHNLTSHTYNPSKAEIVFQTAVHFLPDAQYLFEQLVRRND